MCDVVVPKFVRVLSSEPMKNAFLIIEKSRRLWWSRDGVFFRQGFRSGGECKRLEVDSRQVIPREDPLTQGRTVSRIVWWVMMHAYDQQVGTQNFESGL